MGNGQKIDTSKRTDLIQHTDIKVVATLLCGKIGVVKDDQLVIIQDPMITLKGITRKKSTKQCRFFLENNGSIPFSKLILSYYNDKLWVSPKSYAGKVNDLKDLISSAAEEN